ncbi:hypothetical protein BM1_03889 [Bipolaris maydis]|nr:hypothetical protein BM1_03889 [Bipolaris maydis]
MAVWVWVDACFGFGSGGMRPGVVWAGWWAMAVHGKRVQPCLHLCRPRTAAAAPATHTHKERPWMEWHGPSPSVPALGSGWTDVDGWAVAAKTRKTGECVDKESRC